LEKEIYDSLQPKERAAFRICGDLAALHFEKKKEAAFFMAYGQMARRLDIRDIEAFRIIRTLRSLVIIDLKEKGLRWKQGQF
jgi:hypothetical protein